MVSRGTLKEGEPHPVAYSAMKWFRENVTLHDIAQWKEAFASCAIESNRMGEICIETLNRLTEKKPVSDRYLLGLMWMMRDTICKKGVPDTCPNCGEIIGISTQKTTGG